jgi:hypothetical protein
MMHFQQSQLCDINTIDELEVLWLLMSMACFKVIFQYFAVVEHDAEEYLDLTVKVTWGYRILYFSPSPWNIQ